MSESSPCWIRLAPNGIEINLHADFRGGFALPQGVDDAVISVSADSDFLLYLDGVELGGGQFSDYPDRPTATEFHTGALEAGEHLLAALVWFRGKDFSTCGRGSSASAARPRGKRGLTRRSPPVRSRTSPASSVS